ncbi:DNA-binding SARP family transcriptional activator [Nocardia sp. GAS34]|uniref:AfsR/SARP family transcriptional regulator n=1 Tax=unclassified Nocardia TaxID=2637762 RepID=UPI003D1E1749
MPPPAPPSTRAAECAALVAVAGIGPRSGVTTITLALARTWPARGVIVVEAAPSGGQLAQLIGADPYQGVASLARTARTGTSTQAGSRAGEWTGHLQVLPGGVGLLAAPPGASPARDVFTAALLTGLDRAADARAASADHHSPVVLADCGAPEPGSPTATILAAADACLIVVDTDRHDPAHARARILALTDLCRRRAVLLLGTGSPRQYATALALPVLASLPIAPGAASALGEGTRRRYRRDRLLTAARTVADTVQAHLHPPAPASSTSPASEPTPPAPPPRPARRPATEPAIYQIEPPTGTPSAPNQAPATPPPHHPSTSGPDTGHSPRAPRPAVPEPIVGPLRAPAGPEPDPEPGHRTIHPATVPDPVAADPKPPGPTVPLTPRLKEPGPGAGSPGAVLSVQVFGPLRVWWQPGTGSGQPGRVEITRSLRRRERDLLIVLAVHPHGAARDALIAALWPEQTLARPTNALNTVASRLRAAITTATEEAVTEILDHDTGRYRLRPDIWEVDYQRFDTAVAALRATTAASADREHACRAILAAADGVLGEDFTGDWIAPIREHARRDRLKAVGKLAAMLVQTDPDQTLALLETALINDPTNEPIYQDILRLHARLGERTAINPTLALLKRRLETIGDLPTQTTLDIATHLRNQHRNKPGTGPDETPTTNPSRK